MTPSRRHFVRQGLQASLIAFTGATLLPACCSGIGKKKKSPKAGQLTDLVLRLSKAPALNPTETQQLVSLLTAFNTMYRPHEAREDTVLFPAFRKLVSRHEYDSLGEEFENNEQNILAKTVSKRWSPKSPA